MNQSPVCNIVLKKVACGCTIGCHRSCGCRKLGIIYLIFCKQCMNVNCENVRVTEITEDDVLVDIDKDIDIQFDNIIKEI